MAELIFRKGFALKHEVAGALDADYHSSFVQDIKAADFRYQSGRLTVHLAREFGFCYGVDRAVEYAYQARRRFPDQTVHLTGEIIHNPQVNDKLRGLGIRFLSDPGHAIGQLGPGDVVILPAFGVTVGLLAELQRQGCTLVDTTCGSVLNVWKNVRQYARDGFTAVIHGKIHHEETQATASQATNERPGGKYLVVLNRAEALEICGFISGGGDPAAFLARFGGAACDGFDPERDLQRIGLANQTTMLASESLEIASIFREAMAARYGEADLPARYRAFETICSATQDRQDAVNALLDAHPLDLMLVIGGYNSSNTANLAKICALRRPTYHISDVSALRSSTEVRHRPVTGGEIVTAGWLPAGGPVVVGMTAGASTPDNIVGLAVRRLDELANTPS